MAAAPHSFRRPASLPLNLSLSQRPMPATSCGSGPSAPLVYCHMVHVFQVACTTLRPVLRHPTDAKVIRPNEEAGVIRLFSVRGKCGVHEIVALRGLLNDPEYPRRLCLDQIDTSVMVGKIDYHVDHRHRAPSRGVSASLRRLRMVRKRRGHG
jgi:hypothetical protein